MCVVYVVVVVDVWRGRAAPTEKGRSMVPIGCSHRMGRMDGHSVARSLIHSFTHSRTHALIHPLASSSNAYSPTRPELRASTEHSWDVTPPYPVWRSITSVAAHTRFASSVHRTILSVKVYPVQSKSKARHRARCLMRCGV